jgi:hypothetical protein
MNLEETELTVIQHPKATNQYQLGASQLIVEEDSYGDNDTFRNNSDEESISIDTPTPDTGRSDTLTTARTLVTSDALITETSWTNSENSTIRILNNDKDWVFGIYYRFGVSPRLTFFRTIVFISLLDGLNLVFSGLLMVPLFNTRDLGQRVN